MLTNTFSLRRAAIAYVFAANPGLTREDNLGYYDKVTAQGVDVPEFSQQPAGIRLSRETSGTRSNVFEIQVGEHQGNFRFLVADTWPTKPISLIGENADIAWDCFKEVWPLTRLGNRPILIEASLRLSAAAEGGNATEFLANQSMQLSHAALAKLGRKVAGVGLKLVIPLEIKPGGDEGMPLYGATTTVRIETLMDDPSRLYFEIVTKWPAVPVPEELRKATGAPAMLNPEAAKPTAYLESTYDFVTTKVADFLTTKRG